MAAEIEKPATVFLSYARADRKRALPVIAALERAGIEVWWDGLLEGGESFLPTTEAALEGADAVVVLWSKTSVDSHWVRDEATRGRERQCLVPLGIDGTPPPLGFRQFQTIDFRHWRSKPDAPEMQRAIRAVEGFAGREPGPAPVARPGWRPDRRALLAGGAAAAVAGAGLLVWRGGLLGGTGAPGNSVAVLPFRNLGGDAEQDYFAQGVSEQIRTALSRNARLLVLAPASIASAAREGAGNLKGVAAKLGVAFLLDGTVRRAGQELRISATLTDGKTGFTGWSEQFERKLDDVFAIQDEIAGAVAAALAAQTAGTGQSDSRQLGGTASVAAYDAYLRGNAYYELRSGEAAYRSALAQYDAAVDRDDKFALAHAARARVIVVITNSYAAASEFKAAYDDATAAARRAVALAPGSAVAQMTLGYVLVQARLDLRGAAQPYETARRLGGGDASVLGLYAAYSGQMGLKAKAADAAARAMALDPLNPGVFRLAAFVAYCGRDWLLALERARKALALNPRIDGCHNMLGDTLVQLARPDEARSEYVAEPNELLRLTGLAITDRKLGKPGDARHWLDELVKRLGDAASYQQAQILAQWGELDAALAKLRFAREIGDVGLALAFTDPLLDPLRTRPEFSGLLSELGFG